MRNLMVFVSFLVMASSEAQLPIMLGSSKEFEPLSINYGQLPDLGRTELRNYGINLNLVKPLTKGILGLGLAYQRFDFNFNESTNALELSTFEKMNTINMGIFYVRPLKNNWGLLFSGGTALMSNFAAGISGEDFVFNALVGFTKKWGDENRNSNLLFGAFYGTQFGEPTVFPAISFNQKLNERWSYSLGIPVTGLTYTINETQSISLLASPQGIFGNNADEIPVTGNRTLKNTKLQFNGIHTRLSYRFRFTGNLAFIGEAGLFANPTLKILDSANEAIFDFDPESSTYFNLGLRYVLQKQQKNSTK
ncbi:MAG: DUF6268 family outer membrane beta-barrel protein [Bacteroidota bacterium]